MMGAEACAQGKLDQIQSERIEAARIESGYQYNLGRFERLSGPGDYVNARIVEMLFDSSTHMMVVRGIVQRDNPGGFPDDSLIIAVGELLEVRGGHLQQLQCSKEDTLSHKIDRSGPAMSPEERRKYAAQAIENHLRSNPVTDHVPPQYVRFGADVYRAKVDRDGKFELRAPISSNSNLVVAAPHRFTVIYRLGDVLM